MNALRDCAARFSKHIWIELIAFDATAEDCGVGLVLDPMGARPEVVSLLLYSAEFLHTHTNVDEDFLPLECTSYGARPVSARGPRQDWRRTDLRRLVVQLQEAGLAVQFAVFDLHGYSVGGERKRGEWLEAHPELTAVDADGAPMLGLFNPLSVMADGTRYQDFFVERLVEVVAYYGFDGVHGADGFSSGRLALWRGDFSDAHTASFEEIAGLSIPARSVPDRAAWILAHARSEWTDFHVDRWSDFWTRTCEALHALGKTVVLNNAWTRDPLEAVVRYGVDYSRLVDAGVDGFVLETSASAVELLEDTTFPPIHGQLACVLLMAVTVSGSRLSGLAALHDTYEEWDVVNLAPAMLERDLTLLTSLRVLGEDGVTRPALDAALFCLSDGLDAAAWARVDGLLESLDAAPGDESASPVLLYDPRIAGEERRTFAADALAHTHALLAAILRAGGAVSTVARPEALRGHGTTLVLRDDLYEAETIADVVRRCARVILVGARRSDTGEYTGEWSVRVHEGGGSRPAREWRGAGVRPTGGEPMSWLHELVMVTPPADVVRAVAEQLRPSIGDGGVRGAIGADPRVQVTVTSTQARTTVILHNTHHRFQDAAFVSEGLSREPRTLSRAEAALPVRVVEGLIEVRVPPHGVVSLDIA